MTVILGARPHEEDPDRRSIGTDRVASGTSWESRRRHYHAARRPVAFATWQETPAASKPVRATVCSPDPIAPGLMMMYAARMAHAQVDDSIVRAAGDGDRLLVGEYQADGQRNRSLVVLRTNLLGRATGAHYRQLHSGLDLSGARLFPNHHDKARDIADSVQRRIAGIATVPGALAEGVRGMWGLGGSSHALTRTGASRRAMLAVLAAILVLASFASSGLAQQYRYTVESGDTIDSVAEEFGVDPDAIRASSYLPDGDNLSAGQVIIIPEQGQSPADAAQMAAANEGTSPWVAGAYWVEYGDNPASIAGRFGVDLGDLLAFNDIDDPLELIPGTRIMIPDTGSSAGGSDSSAITVDGVPEYKQQHNLSCEYAATHAAAMAFGWAPSEADFMSLVPQALNPHYGYRGNIDGWWGNTDDYGIYAEALVPVLNDWGFEGEVMYTFGDVGPLIEHIDAGHPVVTWLGFWGDTRERLSDDGNYSVFAGMHVVTVYGYDDDGVWVMDPAKGQKVHYSWDFFVSMWKVIDGMSLAVYPA